MNNAAAISSSSAAVISGAADFVNAGVLAHREGHIELATSLFRDAITLQPTLAKAHFNLGVMLLLQQQYEEGWREYDWRWLTPEYKPRPFHWPLWRGETLEPYELLIWNEQGLGDEILYASMMAETGRAVWEVEPRLVRLLQRSGWPEATVVSREFPPHEFSGIKAHLPAGTLGHFLRRHMMDFPIERKSYLQVDPHLARQFRKSLPADKRIVGISWKSTNPEWADAKSIPLMQWDEILNVGAASNCQFVCIQHGGIEEEREAMKGRGLLYFENPYLDDDMDGFAAIIAACDLVVTVSNTVAHLAGALGIETWVLVPSGERLWYWGTEDKTTTPWYPTARLFRQKRGEDWGYVLAEVAEKLKKR